MPTTYATSMECGYAAGIKTVTDYTYPTASMVDIWRLIAYSKIRFRIGQVSDNANRDAAAIEISMVSRMIQSVQNRQTGFSIELTDEERIQLDNNFGISGVITENPSTGSDLISAIAVNGTALYLAGQEFGRTRFSNTKAPSSRRIRKS